MCECWFCLVHTPERRLKEEAGLYSALASHALQYGVCV